MNKIFQTYISALLADATYALGKPNQGNLTGATSDRLTGYLSERMTPILARYIGDNLTVVTHHETDDFFGSGFDATVWRDTVGNVYVSMQGTTGFGDILTDIDLTASGAAKAQIVDMVNWWLKNTTPIGQDAKQIALFHDTFLLIPSIAGTGLLSDVTHLSVNGHSLGGHLATAFARLFGGQWSIGHTDTYNSAGFTLNSGTVFDSIASLLGPNVGMGRFPNEDEQSNFFAENGINATTRTLFNGQEGLRTPLFNEESTGIPNHYMYKLTDALALGDVLARIDNTFDITRMNNLFESGSNKADASLESILDALVHLFIGNSISDTPIGDEGDSLNSRVIYHFNLAALKDELFDDATVLNPQLKPNYQNLRIVDVASLAGSASLDKAEGLAYRYALTELNPFAMVGADYNVHNNGALDFYNPTTGQGKITDQWLTDRAQMLSHLLQRNHDDTNYASSISADQIFEDYALPGIFDDTHLILTGPETLAENSRQIIFGDDSANIDITGGNKNDHLYGGGGDDLVTGGKGNDYLEGGAGSDIYAFIAGDGMDTILDTDGQGKITLDGIQIKGQTGIDSAEWRQLSSATWQDQQNHITYHLQTETDNSQTLYILKDSGVIKIQNWRPGAIGSLGVTLGEGTAPVAVVRTFTGDQRAPLIGVEVDLNIDASDLRYNTYNWGAVSWNADGTLGSGIAEADFNDVITGSADADKIDGLGGNDAMDGGAGDDQIDGGTGNDLIAGGAGSDIIHGGAGNDQILGATGLNTPQRGKVDDNWQDSYSLAAGTPAWIHGSTWGVAANQNGALTIYGGGSLIQDNAADVVYGDAGDDSIIGGRGDDYLDGGADNDTLRGAGGNDILDGGAGDDYLEGDGTVEAGFYSTTPASSHGNDFLDGGAGSDWLYGGGKNDILLGGSENDFLWGDDLNETQLPGQYHGQDYLDGGDGDDQLIGGGGDDTLIGGNGTDLLLGDDVESDLSVQYHGNDSLDGGIGNDYLYGNGGNDTLLGGADNDTLDGGAGNDTLIGGTGNDVLYGGAGFDTYIVNAGDGVDTIIDSDPEKNSKIIFGQGVDSDDITLRLGSLMLDMGNGNAVHIEGFDPNDVFNSSAVGSFQFADGTELNLEQLLARGFDLDGTGQDDTLMGTNTSDRINGYGGNDNLFGQAGNDTLDGGAGADYLAGGAGDDVYLNVDGEDTLNDTEGHNTIRLATATGLGAAGLSVAHYGPQNQYLRLDIALSNGETLKLEDAFYGTNATLVFSGGNTLDLKTLVGTQLNTALNLQLGDTGGVLYGGTGADSLSGGIGADRLSGALGADKLYGRAGNDMLNGGDGADILDAGDGDDTLIGGAGRDLLLGGSGNDEYQLGTEAGGDLITDTQGQNLLKFGTDINANDLTVRTSTLAGQAALTLSLAGAELATITQGYRSFGFEFADGARLTADELLLDYRLEVDNDYAGSGADTLMGSRGADSLSGYAGNDTLWGGKGDDVLEGGLGSDDYRYRLGDGQDTIFEFDDSEAGQSSQDRVSFSNNIAFDDVSFSRRANGDLSVKVAGLSDAITVSGWYNDPANRVESFVFADGQTVTADTLSALPITPQTGGDGDDTLLGIEYRDVLIAGAGDDVLIGNGGDDDLHGETGMDTYRLAPGSGADRVFELSGESSVIEIGGYDLTRLTAARIGDDLILGITAAADSLRLTNYYTMPHEWRVTANENGVLQNLDAVLTDNAAARAGQGDLQRLEDNFLAQIGDEVAQWYGEQGMVRQADGSWLSDLRLGVSQQVNTYSRATGYTGFVPGNATQYSLSQNFNFALGRLSISTYSAEEAANYADDSSSYQTKNVHVSWGAPQTTSDSQPYTVAAGHYLYTAEELQALLLALNVSAVPNPYVYDTKLAYTRTTTQTSYFATTVSIADADGSGYVLDAADAQNFYNQPTLPTTLAVETELKNVDIGIINGTDGDDDIRTIGYFGIIRAGAGNDMLGVYNDESEGVSSERVPSNLSSLSEFSTLFDGGLGNDVLIGDRTGNLLIGGQGDDILRGGDGADRYYFLAGDAGTDLIYDVDRTRGYGEDQTTVVSHTDSVVFGTGIALSDLTFSWGSEMLPDHVYGSYDESRIGLFQTLDISWQPGAVARIVMPTLFLNEYGELVENNERESLGVELFEFADGSSLTMTQLLELPGTPVRPEIERFGARQSGGWDADELLGESGPDDLFGDSGDDILLGNNGDDWLFGGEGDDWLAGGEGSDRYYFHTLDNRYFFNSSDTGIDLLYDTGNIGDTDTVVFGPDIALSDFSISWGSEALSTLNNGTVTWFETLNIGWQADSVLKIVLPRLDTDNEMDIGVEFFEFADGSEMTMAQMLTLAGPSPEHAPILNAPLSDQQAYTGVAFSYKLPADAFVDADVGDVLSYGYSTVLDWLTFDPETRTFTGIADANALGSTEITVTATDRFGASVSDSFSLTVNPVVAGTAGNDVLQGTEGDDGMVGDAGNDLLKGGAGRDTYIINLNDGRDTIVDAAGDNNVISFGSGITPADITLRLGSLMLDLGNGNELHIEGFNPDDVFNSSSIDTFTFSDGSVLSLEQLLARGFDLAGTTSDDVINGTNISDRIKGLDGNDILIGGAGDDILSGDSHEDTPNASLIEQLVINAKASLLNDGVPARMEVYVDGVLKASFAVANTEGFADYSVDPALLGSGRRIDIAFANDGYVAGNPVQDRNLYIDHIKVNDQTIAATANGVQYDLGSGAEAVDGKNLIAGRVVMAWGGALRFSLEGNDLLNGGTGADIMSGGLGDDVYFIDNIADTVNEIADGGFDTIRSRISFDLNAAAHVENLSLTGSDSINAVGNSLNNTLLGNTANNRLDGGLGADRMEGGKGDDEYVVDNSGDVVSEAANAGVDSVAASISYTLTANLENLILTGTDNIDGSGNSLDNNLTGNEAGNQLYGKEGSDILLGNDGDDALYGGDGDDMLYGGRMDETSSSAPLNQLVISAKASLLNDGVAAQMDVYVDGILKTSFAVSNTADFADYNVDPALLGAGAHKVDVVFANDGYIAGNPIQDRNLYVDSIRVNGRGIASNSIGVQYDLGKGNAALDGENLIAGRVVMAWNGALRFGLDGNDLLDGGTGADTLSGGAGSDTYIFGRGYGIDTVIENDATLGNTDTAQFLSDISIDQIWFQHAGNNLEIDIIGTDDKLVVQDWYSGSAYHIEQFKTSDGSTLLDSQVENLINAMAAFAPPAAGETTLPPDYQTQLAPVLAANWH